MLLSQQDINNFNKDWTIKIGNILLDVTQIDATKWDEEKGSDGKPIALKVKPYLYPHHSPSSADIKSGKVKICQVQRMVSDTPPGCLWGLNYLRIPMTPQGKAIAKLILDKMEEYEDYGHEMSDAYAGVYDIPHQ